MRGCPALPLVSLPLGFLSLLPPHFRVPLSLRSGFGKGGTVPGGWELRGQLCSAGRGAALRSGGMEPRMGDSRPWGDDAPWAPGLHGAVLEATPTRSDPNPWGRGCRTGGTRGAARLRLSLRLLRLHPLSPRCGAWRWGAAICISTPPPRPHSPQDHPPQRCTHAGPRSINPLQPCGGPRSPLAPQPCAPPALLDAERPRPHACPLLKPHSGVGSSAAP